MFVYAESEVVWKDIGEDITIRCKCSEPDQDYIELKKGLSKEAQVLVIEKKSGKRTILNNFQGRLQVNGELHNIDILIKNLTSNDTGPYWCMYKKADKTTYKSIITEGKGSVLLVINGKPHYFINFITN